MSPTVKLSALALLALAFNLPCNAQSPAIIAQKLYDQLEQSYANHSLEQVLAFSDPSYTVVDEKGQHQSYAEWRKEKTGNFNNPTVKNLTMQIVVQDAQLKDGRLVVYYQVQTHWQFQDKTQGWEPVIGSSSQEDTWEKKGDQWKRVATHVLRSTAGVDRDWLIMKHQETMNQLQSVQRAADSALRPCTQSYNGC